MPKESKGTVQKNQVRKEYIIEAALSLFSEKGFENTRVDEIAEKAGVNKALIYYHFESKDAILSYLLDEFLAGVKIREMDFIANNIIKAIQEGDLDILPDRMRFASEEALAKFMKEMRRNAEEMLDYILDNRDTVRLMLAESLKRGNNQMSLFQFVEFMEQKESNPMYRSIRDADNDFTYSGAAMISKFFFSILPLLNFAAYFDDYLKVSSMKEKDLRSDFMRAYMNINHYPTQGGDLIMTIGDPFTLPK